MATFKMFNLLALASVALLVITSAPTSVNALATDRSLVARYAHGHDAVAKRKRDSPSSSSSNGRCKPKPTSSSSGSYVSPSSTSSDSSSWTSTYVAPTPTPTPAYTPPASSSSSSTSTYVAPTPTTTPASTSSSSGGGKWGLGWPNGNSDYLVNFATRPNVGFLYTWSPYLPDNLYGLKAIPMLWGYDQISDFQTLVVEGYANYVLGMNEPNESSQSNMSPQDGAALWQQYINPLKDQGYYLVSPACTNDQAGLDWMAGFFQACSGCQVDAVAFHFYSTNAQDFITYATQLHDLYNLPIWVTEFADQNFSGTGGQASLDEVYAFASTIIDFVDNTSWMEAAFPFGVMSDLQGVDTANALLASNDEPTDLAYNYFG
ncbi:glycosyl hydrolase catalytic core-domain-containing protein [Suillus ampliporus]|nr:glycosyl hydrolase catalytic core-domain-containing protein [Suillus ampliporus]